MTDSGDKRETKPGGDSLDVRIDRALEAARDAHLKQIRSELLQDVYNHKNELRNSGNTAFQGALAVVTLFLGILGSGWILQWWDTEKQQQEVNSLSRNTQKVYLANLALAKNYELGAIRDIMEKTKNVLKQVRRGLSVGNTDQWETVRENEERLEKLLEMSDEYTGLQSISIQDDTQAISQQDKEKLSRLVEFFADYQPILKALYDVQRALRTFELIKSKDNNAEPSSDGTKLNRAYKAWHQVRLEPDDFKTQVFKGFVEELKAHRLNMLGLIEMKRYALTGATSLLTDAQDNFEKAMKVDLPDKFPPAARNLGIVYVMQLELASEGDVGRHSADDDSSAVEQSLNLARKAGALFERAQAHALNVIDASWALNNVAYVRLVESQLRETYFFYDDAPELWGAYFQAVRDAAQDKDESIKAGTEKLFEFYRNLWRRLEREAAKSLSGPRPNATAANGDRARPDGALKDPRRLVLALNHVISSQSLYEYWEDRGVVKGVDTKVFSRITDDKLKKSPELRRQLNRMVIDRYLESLIKAFEPPGQQGRERGQPTSDQGVRSAANTSFTQFRQPLEELRQRHVRPYTLSPEELKDQETLRGSGWKSLKKARELLNKAKKPGDVYPLVYLTSIEADCQSYRYQLSKRDLHASLPSAKQPAGQGQTPSVHPRGKSLTADVTDKLTQKAAGPSAGDTDSESQQLSEDCSRADKPISLACLLQSVEENEKSAREKGRLWLPDEAPDEVNRFCSPIDALSRTP